MFISHIHSVIQDKNVQTRTYATTHLKTFIDIHAIKHRHTIEGTSSLLETLVECTRKGLSDVNPGVREEARPAFWSFNAVWPTKGNAILAELDASQNKQLDKVRPQEVAPIAPVRPPVAAAKKSSGIGALLAEKRRAAMAARQDSQRTVSSPVPGSPLLGGGRARSTSQSAQANQVEADSPDGSPQPESKANGASAGSQPQDTPVRSKMATMTISSPRESPSRSPLYQKSSIPTSDPMSSSSSSASQALKTPTISRTSLPHEISTPEARDAQEVHAAEGVMAARQLLELTPQPQPPSTPARGPTSKTHLFPQTPVNGLGIGRNVWEDSPGPTAVTPMMVDKLKGRRHERSWWLKRQQCEHFASP
jgi:CLIP-associating protein 1/2